ncbi:MAG: ribokinase [Ruminococcaceae bacterium]|nr:ribokinase [Oscillospiraceae bacterium]
MKHRILVVSSANMDFVMKVGEMPNAGQTIIETRGYDYVPGGKGANAAVALARLGADSVFCAKLGTDNHGQILKDLYKENGVDTRFIRYDRTVPTGLAAIVVEDNGDNRIIVYPGANSTMNEGNVEEAFNCLPDAVFVQFEIPDEAVIAATKYAKKQGIPVIVDAGPARADYPLEKLTAPLEIISPNESECFALTGIMPNNTENCLKAAVKLQSRVESKYVVIKLGGRGAYIHDGRFSQLIPTYEGKVVDSTAAGDAFTAAMTLEYLRSHDIVRAVKYANAVGTMVVGKAGASSSLPTADEVETFIRMRGITL